MADPFVLELCNYIGENTSLSVGSSLMIGELTIGNEGIYAIIAGSGEPDRYTETKYFLIDFWARYKKFEDAHTNLQVIYELLHQNHHYSLSNFNVFFSNAVSQIQDMDRDANENKMLKISFNFIVQ